MHIVPLALLLCSLLAAPVSAVPLPSAQIAGCTEAAARSGAPLPHGCATARNLEAMLADPADLVSARPLAQPVGEPVVVPVRRHRQGTTPEPAGRPTTSPGP
jgi:type IV pilus biogenesis protein CpaD/CtpE